MANRKYPNAVQAHKAKLQSDYRYKKKAQKAYTLRFHRENDLEVIHKLNTVPNRCDYIRQLILSDLHKEEG